MPTPETLEEVQMELKPESLPFERDHENWEKELRVLITENRDSEIEELLGKLFPADIADLITRLNDEERRRVLIKLDIETRGNILHELDETVRGDAVRSLSAEELAHVVMHQESDEACELLGELDHTDRGDVLSLIAQEDRVRIMELLSYPENTAGNIMSKEFVFIQETDTVQQAMQRIRKELKEDLDFYTVFVLDEGGHYVGHVSFRNLMLASPRTRIKKIIERDLIPIPVTMDQEEVANFFERYDFISAPVVDEQGLMVGRITADDILSVMKDEASEDILRMGGIIHSDGAALNEPLLAASARRILWLGMNLITAFIAASVVSLFQGTIAKAVVLAALLPIVAGMGGNAATQTISVVVRGIALGNLSFATAHRALWREMTLGLMNGLALGLVAGTVVFILTSGQEGFGKATALGAIIALAMLCNMFVAALAGASIPLVLERLGIDPAIASSIFVTTCTDVLGFFAFLGLAALALNAGLL